MEGNARTPGRWDEVGLFAVLFLPVYLLSGFVTGPTPFPGAVGALVLATAGTYAARRGLVQPVLGYETDGRFYAEAVTFGVVLVVALAVGGFVAGAADFGPLGTALVVPLSAAVATVGVLARRR